MEAYNVYLRLIGECIVDFLSVLIERFLLGVIDCLYNTNQ